MEMEISVLTSILTWIPRKKLTYRLDPPYWETFIIRNITFPEWLNQKNSGNCNALFFTGKTQKNVASWTVIVYGLFKETNNFRGKGYFSIFSLLLLVKWHQCDLLISAGDHLFNTHAKFSEKQTLLNPWHANVRVRKRGVKNGSFSKNFGYEINE